MTAPRWDDPGPVVPRSNLSLSYSPVLRVDPERVEGLVGRLEGVIREVALVELSLRTIVAVAPPGRDEVSINAAMQSAAMIEKSGSYLADWRRQLQVAVTALRRQSSGYETSEQVMARRS